MKTWLKTGVVGAGFVLLCLITVACDMPWESNPTGPTQTQQVTVNVGVPSPAPTGSPSPGAGSCPGAALIASVRVNPFGMECPDGIPKPPNNSGLLPVGCVAAVTATPKDAQGNDVPAELHGPDITWSVPIGAEFIQVTDDPIQPFNKNVSAVSAPGEFQLMAEVCGKRGAWNGRTVATFP